MKIKNMVKTVGVLSTVVVASTAHAAADLSSITSAVDLSGASQGVVAVGVAVGGFLVAALGVRYVLGFLKRV